eukprot:1881176-Rhodomonas_salina.1
MRRGADHCDDIAEKEQDNDTCQHRALCQPRIAHRMHTQRQGAYPRTADSPAPSPDFSSMYSRGGLPMELGVNLEFGQLLLGASSACKQRSSQLYILYSHFSAV